MLSTDASILESASESQSRMKDYGTLAERLDIIVCTVSPHREFAISDRVRAIPTNSRSKLWYVLDMLRIAKQSINGTVDVVTAQDPFETGLAGWLIRRRLKSKLQLQVHTDFLSPYFGRMSFKNFIRVNIAKRLLPKADSIRVVSERIKRSLVDLGLPEEKIAVLPIFVSLVPNEAPEIDLHKKYSQFETIVFMASRLEPEKNISLAIRAFADVARANSKIGLVIAGSGSEQKHLEQLVAMYQLQDSVVFEGFVRNLAQYFASADIFLNTSNYEGYGRTLIEAAVAGLPIITTDVGLVGEIINQENSIVVPVGDGNALTEAMLRLVADEAVRAQLGAVARSVVLQLPDKEALLERQKQLWQM